MINSSFKTTRAMDAMPTSLDIARSPKGHMMYLFSNQAKVIAKVILFKLKTSTIDYVMQATSFFFTHFSLRVATASAPD